MHRLSQMLRFRILFGIRACIWLLTISLAPSVNIKRLLFWKEWIIKILTLALSLRESSIWNMSPYLMKTWKTRYRWTLLRSWEGADFSEEVWWWLELVWAGRTILWPSMWYILFLTALSKSFFNSFVGPDSTVNAFWGFLPVLK